MIDKQKIQVKMDGDSYIKYMMYKDRQKQLRSQRIMEALKRNTSVIIVTIIFILIALVYMAMTYTPPEPSSFEYSWNGILMFLAISAGVGWILHGVGFAIVGRLN